LATYVLVHGGWVGGWFWRRLAPLLGAAGHEVLRPTLTGLGERSHLSSPAITLDTHARDVVNVLEFEDLREVILVGHSYSGMVITAAAEASAARVAQMVYLDAFVPRDGETLADLLGPDMTAAFVYLAESEGEGWRIPLPFPLEAFGFSRADVAWMSPRMSDQPLRTMTEPVRLGGGNAERLPRTFIACNRGATGLFAESARRARGAQWQFYDLDVPHGAAVTDPRAVADLLLSLTERRPV